MAERRINLNAPKKSIVCNTCNAKRDLECLMAKLEIEIRRVPTVKEAKEAEINVDSIPGIMCFNDYTNPSNLRIL